MQRLHTCRPACAIGVLTAATLKICSRRSAVRKAARITSLFGVKERGAQSAGARNRMNLAFAEAPRVARAVPIKIRNHRSLRTKVLVPEAFKKVPIDEALNVIVAALDAEFWNIRGIKLHVEGAQALAKLRQLFRHRP